MKTTRQRILEYLQVKGAATPLEISRALHLTPANIRHHLSILLEEGTLEVAGTRSAGLRGRPARMIALSRQASAHYLDGLASALLAEMAATLPPLELQEVLKKIAIRLFSGDHGSASESTGAGSFTQRLTRAISHLNEMNYQARWEARPAAPRLILGHCPYAAILPSHPELCQMDAALLEAMLASPVTQVTRLERNPRGLPQCVFLIKMKGNS